MVKGFGAENRSFGLEIENVHIGFFLAGGCASRSSPGHALVILKQDEGRLLNAQRLRGIHLELVKLTDTFHNNVPAMVVRVLTPAGHSRPYCAHLQSSQNDGANLSHDHGTAPPLFLGRLKRPT